MVERGLITDSELTHALAEQKQSGRLLGEIFVAGYGVSRVDLADVLAEQWEEAQKLTGRGRQDRSAGTVEHHAAETRTADPASEEDELRVLLEEAESARAELARKTDELGQRLAALEALVIGVSGALDELRRGGGHDGESDGPPAATPSRQVRSRSARRPTVSR